MTTISRCSTRPRPSADIATRCRDLGLAENQVRIVALFVGGGFAARPPWQNTVLCAWQRVVKRPSSLLCLAAGLPRGWRRTLEQRDLLGAGAVDS
jgi:hypothetical protein